MGTLKGAQTEKNLLKAFAGESQARNRKWVCVRPRDRAVSIRWPVEEMGRNSVIPSTIAMTSV
ncbi:MAG: hypothetical protein A2Y65_00550 [Deltaproteobacteria bacterium RBG_13_52_11]|nr:MAG: hypothetical protein A2Y65_00550 [Deltaproteobacteria bacterium RBG_13_52_11]